jgi:hypothetical protein
MVLAHLVLVLGLAQVPGVTRERVATAGGLELPRDPLTELVLRIEAARSTGTARRTDALGARPWPEWTRGAASAWNREEPWRRWVELVRDEAGARAPDPARRAQLALLARSQGRDTDAWRHLRACGEDEVVLDLLPAFVPGVPRELLGEAALPDGVRLRPALPPSTDDAGETLTTLAGRSTLASEVRVGEATLSFELAVQGDGVQVDLVHRSGPLVRVSVLLPAPRGVEIALTYADWEKLPDPKAWIEVELSAEEPEHTLWGRFLPREDRWPMPLPAETAGTAMRAPLAIAPGAPGADGSGPDGDGRLPRFAEALAELFDRPCLWPYSPRARPSVQDGGPLEPIVIHLGSGPDPERKLIAMLSLAELHALEGPGRIGGAR